MNTISKTAHADSLWFARARNLALGLAALGSVAVATPAEAAATYSSYTDFQVFATVNEGAVGASAVGNNFLLSANANGDSFASATHTGGDRVPVDILAGIFNLTATATGEASGNSDADSDSLNDVRITLTNLGSTLATVILTITWDQAVTVGTMLPGETARAESDILLSDSLGGILLDSLISVDAIDGLFDNDADASSRSFVYTLNPNNPVVDIIGTVDAFGFASAVSVPEPGSLALLLIGVGAAQLAGIGAARRRKTS